MARTPRDGGRPQEGRHPVPPPPVSPATVPAGCRKTDALFKCGTIIYKIRLLSCLFAKRGTIAGPPDNGGDLTYRPEQKLRVLHKECYNGILQLRSSLCNTVQNVRQSGL